MTLYELIDSLNTIEQRKHAEAGYTHPADLWHVGKKGGRKFAHINCGSSGAFLLEIATGELYNIKAYGQPDYNKKKKADIGNITSVDPETLHSKRWNYLR